MPGQLRFAARWPGSLHSLHLRVPPLTCRDGTQNVQGSWIATPYCQDVLLAQVAHENGFPASVEKIRNNPQFKKELCRGVFTDIRVTDTCLNAGIPEYRR